MYLARENKNANFPAAKTDLIIALGNWGIAQKKNEPINAALFKLSEINAKGKE